MQFNMSFDWNTTRLEQQKQVMVHQEITIPKQSELVSISYVATCHFMLSKPVVMQIAEQVNKNGQASS